MRYPETAAAELPVPPGPRGSDPEPLEQETKEGKLIGAAILKATQQGRLAEEDRMRQLMFDAAPRTMAEGESRFKG